MRAAAGGRLEIIITLIEHKANLDIISNVRTATCYFIMILKIILCLFGSLCDCIYHMHGYCSAMEAFKFIGQDRSN